MLVPPDVVNLSKVVPLTPVQVSVGRCVALLLFLLKKPPHGVLVQGAHLGVRLALVVQVGVARLQLLSYLPTREAGSLQQFPKI